MRGFELDRVETLLRERSAELTRTRAASQLHPSLLDPPAERPSRTQEPTPVVEVSLEGVCSDCGDRIAAGRLKALPDATRCVACQREFESRAG